MRISKVVINNFRGIKSGIVLFPNHSVMVGDNNTGKSTVLEAIDLVLGPDRMRRKPPINEHDFYAGDYLDAEKNPVEIYIEVTVVDINDEQQRHFKDHVEWWDVNTDSLVQGPSPEAIEPETVLPALRVCFKGSYDSEEDDFIGNTFFQLPTKDDGNLVPFKTKDKRFCGFLYLRTLRTGSRALSLERGSLLDIILQLSEIKLDMWEETLEQIRVINVADNPELGVSNILSGVQESLKSFVPYDWGTNPQMKVSDFTREHLRKTLNVFMSTGAKKINGEDHIAPFKKQGTGTINTLVLSMLSLIAELKQNVIFAMEEPEIAIPPHTQKRIINSVRGKSSQAIFTSHSPYVLEEFDPKEIVVLSNKNGVVSSSVAGFTSNIKRKSYQLEFRKRYCEALLAKRVLIAEGRTEYDAIPMVARHLNHLKPDKYSSLEALGIAIIDAETDSQIIPIASLLKSLGKTTYAIFDKQEEDQGNGISSEVDYPYESPEKSFEKLIMNQIPISRLKSFALSLVTDKEWPTHLNSSKPETGSSDDEIKSQLGQYFGWSKGAGTAAVLLQGCSYDEIPSFIKDTLKSLKQTVDQSQDNTVSQETSLDDLIDF